MTIQIKNRTRQNALSQQKTPGKKSKPVGKQKTEKEIKKTNNEIDELVYQLYGITDEEKKIIEESLK